VLKLLEIPTSTWYRRGVCEGAAQRPGPAPQPVPEPVVTAVKAKAEANPSYGCKRIAVMCRRSGEAVTNRAAHLVMKASGLLQKRRSPKAEIYQAAKLFELLQTKPNDLWQADVTYIRIPGFGYR
jgi:hypothetical protein